MAHPHHEADREHGKRGPSVPLLLLAGIAVVAAWLWANRETALPAVAHETSGARSVFVTTVASDAGEVAASRIEAGAAQDDDPTAATTIRVLPAFWFYVDGVRSLTTTEARWREVRMPATALREMSRETLRQLAIESLDGMASGPVVACSPDGVQVPLWASLFGRWCSIATRTGEDLAGAALQFALETIGSRLWEADPPLLHLSMRMLGHFTEVDADVARFAPPLLDVLRGIPQDVEPASDTMGPVLQVLARASWPDNRGWLRRQLLELLDAPWMTKARVASFLMQMTAGSSYATWAAEIDHLIAAGSPAAVWGAIEALRGFAATGQITPEALVLALPERLLLHPDSTLRWALYELLAAFGGASGEARLTMLLQTASFPFRAEVLSYLAFHGKVDAAVCVALLQGTDKALRDAAIAALGHLAKTSAVAVTFLADLALGSTDAEIRLLAVRSLGTCQRPEVLDLLQKALADADPGVQLEAIAQLGRFERPQPERLFAAARDLNLSAPCRALAYRELILDAADEDADAIFRSMYGDPDADISSEGYVWQAALAVARRDEGGLNAWRQLPIPARILEELASNPALGAIVGSVYDIRAGIVDEVQKRIAMLTSPESRAAIAEKRTRDHLFGIDTNSGFRRHLAYEERILRFLGR